MTPGYGMTNLSRGRDDILSSLGKQFSRDTVVGRHPGCVKCGARLLGPTLMTSDAGQAYEMIHPSKIEKTFRKFLRQSVPPPNNKTLPSPSSTAPKPNLNMVDGFVPLRPKRLFP